jgi:ubiquinone/menaquinone biosynthesis C-methylase UbiE
MSATQSTTAMVDWSVVAAGWHRYRTTVETVKAELTSRLLDGLALGSGDRVLELGAGTGELARQLAAAVGPEGHVTASDVAEGMVELIRGTTADLPQVDACRLDALDIDRSDASYNAVVFRMGLMFVVPPLTALQEIRRVLKPGGRLALTTWAGPEDNMWLASVGMAATVHGVLAGVMPTMPGGPMSLSDPAAVETLAREAGFTEVAVQLVDVVFDVEGVDEHLDQVRSMAPPLATAFAEATDEQRAAVRATVADLTAQFVTDTGLAIPGRALLIEAQ